MLATINHVPILIRCVASATLDLIGFSHPKGDTLQNLSLGCPNGLSPIITPVLGAAYGIVNRYLPNIAVNFEKPPVCIAVVRLVTCYLLHA
jgi:hypothetical protein